MVFFRTTLLRLEEAFVANCRSATDSFTHIYCRAMKTSEMSMVNQDAYVTLLDQR